jgi:hypothetical protein
MSLTLTRLPSRPHDWDAQIQAFGSKTLFHESAWLDHVLSIHPRANIHYFRIESVKRHGDILGLFCTMSLRKLFVNVYGSPLPGTGTNYMGPLVDGGTAFDEAIAVIVEFCRHHYIAHLELAHDWLNVSAAHRMNLDVHEGVTHVVPLPSDEEAAFAAMKSTCRNRVRKAQKNKLVAEVTDDPTIVDRFYEQFIEVYAKQGLDVPYGIDRARSLYENLYPAQRLLPIWVRNGDEVIAAGLFPYDQHAIYFWGAASWLKDQHLHPNELLHWTVMREAVQRRIPIYNMCGGASQFKDKFGGTDVPYNHFSRTFIPGLRKARDLYRDLHWKRLKIAGWVKGISAVRPSKPFPDTSQTSPVDGSVEPRDS